MGYSRIDQYAKHHTPESLKNLNYQTIYITYSADCKSFAKDCQNAVTGMNFVSPMGVKYNVELLPIEANLGMRGFIVRRYDLSSIGRYALLSLSYTSIENRRFVADIYYLIKSAEEYSCWDEEWIHECDHNTLIFDATEGEFYALDIIDLLRKQQKEKESISKKKEQQKDDDRVSRNIAFQKADPIDFDCDYYIRSCDVVTEFTSEGFAPGPEERKEIIDEKRESDNEILSDLVKKFKELLKERLAQGATINEKTLQDIASEISVLTTGSKDIRIIVNKNYKVILTNCDNDEIELKFAGITDKVLYLFFLIYDVCIPLRELSNYEKELDRIYLYCKPGASDETRKNSINNLVDLSKDTFNQVKSRINRAITAAVPSPVHREKLKISGIRNGNYSIDIDRELVTIYANFGEIKP